MPTRTHSLKYKNINENQKQTRSTRVKLMAITALQNSSKLASDYQLHPLKQISIYKGVIMQNINIIQCQNFHLYSNWATYLLKSKIH